MDDSQKKYSFTTNDRLKTIENTKFADIDDLKIKGTSYINYLPLSKITTTYMYTSIASFSNTTKLFSIPYYRHSSIRAGIYLNKLGLEEGKKYKVLWKVVNVVNLDKYPNSVLISNDVNEVLTAGIFIRNGETLRLKDYLNEYMVDEFTYTDDNPMLYFIYGFKEYNNAANTDATYQIEVYGIVDADNQNVFERTDSMMCNISNQSISTSEYNPKIGEYQLSDDIKRHFKQIERKINYMQDFYKVTCR